MTIAVGLLLPSSEVIIAADSQESYEHAKMEGHKIMALQVKSPEGVLQGSVVFTGAGSAGYLDSLGQKILAAFLKAHRRDEKRELDARAIADEFEATIGRFYKRHVIPFGATWAKEEGLNVSAIIAFQRAHTRGLVESVNNAAIIDKPVTAVGTGSTHALALLKPLVDCNSHFES